MCESCQIIGWATEGESCSIVAGLVALVIGLVIGLTSMPCVRRKWYELFFGVHHLYIVFLLFWLYHVIWTVHFIAMPCLLFFIDRFLRMIQSSTVVRVSSAKLFENGAVELLLPLNPNATKGNNILNGFSFIQYVFLFGSTYKLIFQNLSH